MGFSLKEWEKHSFISKMRHLKQMSPHGHIPPTEQQSQEKS